MSQLFIKKIYLLLLLFITMINPAMGENRFITRTEVKNFIDEMVKKHHFQKKALIALFKEVKIRPQVMQHINKPLEKEAWHTYQMFFVTQYHIEEGVKFWNKYINALQRAEKVYGVPAHIIVATIGIETRYGRRTGDFRVIDSLSNIAFSDSPRAPFFRKELEEFLLLSKEQHFNPLKIMGSYAGAIGQPQFMPSSYRNYAVNFSKTGKIDLVNDEIDVIGSIANYYKLNGWTTNGPIAVKAVKLGDRYTFLKHANKLTQPFTIGQATRLGLIPKSRLVTEDLEVKVIELKNHFNKEYWLGFHNFDVIKRYNTSDLYAMAVYQLSHLIRDAREKIKHD